MRKVIYLFVVAIVSLASTATFAQEVKEEVQAVVQEKLQDKSEVKISELPEAVTKTLSDKYAEYTAEKAYKATKDGKDIYYVKLVNGEQHIKVLIDDEGKVIETKE